MEDNDTLENRLRQVVSQRHKVEEPAAARKLEASSKQRLAAIVRKKVTTSFIGALSKFETFMGEVWGHGLEEEECTPSQRAWRQVWEQCRNEVLNQGNNQLRALETEFQQYTIKWQRQNVVLQPKADDRV